MAFFTNYEALLIGYQNGDAVAPSDRTAMGTLMALVGVDTLQLGYHALMDKATGD